MPSLAALYRPPTERVLGFVHSPVGASVRRTAAVAVVVMFGGVVVHAVARADTVWNSAWVDSIAASPDSTARPVSGPLTLSQALRLSARHHPTLTAALW